MNHFIMEIPVRVNDKLYIKNPESSELGKRIVQKGLELIREIGLEQFTFRKLATEIDTTESSVYRYFESKHKLLLYLFSWYWTWIEYQVLFRTNNISEPVNKIEIALDFITSPEFPEKTYSRINMEYLEEVIIRESTKAYLTKNVDEDNLIGSFSSYKAFCHLLGSFVSEVNPEYPYPNTLIATVIEGVHHQKFFAKHLPSLSDSKGDETHLKDCFLSMISSSVKNYVKK